MLICFKCYYCSSLCYYSFDKFITCSFLLDNTILIVGEGNSEDQVQSQLLKEILFSNSSVLQNFSK